MPRRRLKNFSCPRNRFCATVIVGTRLVSWNTIATPMCNASLGVCGATAWPSMNIAPDVSCTTPAITLVKVDLPAPFSPTIEWISPRRNAKSTLSIAGTPAYFLVAWRSSRIGASGDGASTALMGPPWRCAPSPRGGASAFGAAARRSYGQAPFGLGDVDAQHAVAALRQQVELAAAVRGRRDAVVLAVVAAVQRIAHQALVGEPHDQPVRARRRPRLDDAHHLQLCALHRLEEGVARVECRRDPVRRVDLGQHAFAKAVLAQHELDQLRAQRKARQPHAAARGWRQSRRIAGQRVGDALQLCARIAIDARHVMAPAFADPHLARDVAGTIGMAEARRELARAAIGPGELDHAPGPAQAHQVALPLRMRLLARALGHEQLAVGCA